VRQQRCGQLDVFGGGGGVDLVLRQQVHAHATVHGTTDGGGCAGVARCRRKRREHADGAEVVVKPCELHGHVGAADAGGEIEGGGQRVSEKLVDEGIQDLDRRERSRERPRDDEDKRRARQCGGGSGGGARSRRKGGAVGTSRLRPRPIYARAHAPRPRITLSIWPCEVAIRLGVRPCVAF
jgi:hypothetical protein